MLVSSTELTRDKSHAFLRYIISGFKKEDLKQEASMAEDFQKDIMAHSWIPGTSRLFSLGISHFVHNISSRVRCISHGVIICHGHPIFCA